jgi:hypothetical protein
MLKFLVGIQNWLFQKIKLYNHPDQITTYYEIMKKYYPDGNIPTIEKAFVSKSSFHQLVYLKTHPDKGGNTQDFQKMSALKDVMQKPLDAKNFANEIKEAVKPGFLRLFLMGKIMYIIHSVLQFTKYKNADSIKSILTSLFLISTDDARLLRLHEAFNSAKEFSTLCIEWTNWQAKKYIRAKKISRVNEILEEYFIYQSSDAIKDDELFQESLGHIKLPGDVDEVTRLQKSILQDLKREEVDKYVQPIIHKTGIAFKSLNLVTHSIEFINSPNVDNTKSVIFSLSNLYDMIYGINPYSIALTTVDSFYLCYKGNYFQAAEQVIITASYMALPIIVEYSGIPALTFSTLVTGVTVVDSVATAYSLFSNYNSKTWKLESHIAYRDLYDAFSKAPIIKELYDFNSLAEYNQEMIYNIVLGKTNTFDD